MTFFGVFEVPKIASKDEIIFEVSRSIHEILALIIIGCVGLHIVGALKHHWVDKDETMRRMGARAFVAVFGLALLGLATLFWVRGELKYLTSADHDTASMSRETGAGETVVQVIEDKLEKWIIDSEASRIDFTFEQYGSPVGGAFESFDGRIVFDPEDLDNAEALITIQAASIRTGSAERDQQAQSPVWFAAQEYPQIVFKSTDFSKLDANRYVVDGVLRIKGVELPVSFPFLLDIRDLRDGLDEAIMTAEFTLNRLDFNVGEGQWESGEAINPSVSIKLYVRAVQYL